MIARVGLEVVKVPEVLLEETPQPEVVLAAAVADKILEVAPLAVKEKTNTDEENPQIKGKGATTIRNLVCDFWLENAKMRTASLIILKFANFTILKMDVAKTTASLHTLIKKSPALLAPMAEGEGVPA